MSFHLKKENLSTKGSTSMRKSLINLVVFSLFTVPVSAATSNNSIETKIKELKNESFDGYKYLTHQTLQMNESSSKEIISIFKKKIPGTNDYLNDYVIRIHEMKSGKWTNSYKKVLKEQHDLKIITKGQLGKYNHVVVGSKIGSRNILSTHLIGSLDGKTLNTIQTKENIMMGNAKIIKNNLYYMNRSITLSKYTYKKNKLVSSGKTNGRDDRIVAEQPKVWLGLKQKNHSDVVQVIGNKTYTVKVGDRIGIGRYLLEDTKSYEYSLHAYDDSKKSKNTTRVYWDFSKSSLVTKKSGTAYLTLSPSLYVEPVQIKIIIKD